ncbi:MAG: PilN domain-containing protein [Rhodobacteraceae bacterium]|nr:PilN domain-containing protein [Paracoccaceae bacterium]
MKGIDRETGFDVLINLENIEESLSDILQKRRYKIASVQLSEAFFLSVPHRFPKNARGSIGNALALYIRQNTPFTPRDIIWKFRLEKPASQMIVARQFIIKTEVVQSLLHGFGNAGVRVIDMRLYRSPLVFLDQSRQVAKTHHLWQALGRVAIIGALSLAALSAYNNYQSRLETLASLRANTKTLQDQAIALRDGLSRQEDSNAQLITLLDQINTDRRALKVLSNLTSIFPDTVWLAQVSFRQSDVRLAGFSSVAPSTLIAPLANSPVFQEAQLSGPVVRDQRLEQDRFEMSLKVDNTHE